MFGVSLKIHSVFGHLIGKLTRRYYFEDYVRVYPDNIAYNLFGNRVQPNKNNFLNHCKFYKFASQFVTNKVVADIGCGSGYGCEILSKSGAACVYGADISKKAVKFAESRYGDSAEFSLQRITRLNKYEHDFFDISISNEVLEHVKEYGKENIALKELKRITKHNGLVIVGTPNSELLEGHGFTFDEISNLFKNFFSRYCLFENAFLPFKDRKPLWEKRLKEGKVGEIITQNINLSESVLPNGVRPEIKQGLEPGRYTFLQEYSIDTTLLHNTHSWIVIAINR